MLRGHLTQLNTYDLLLTFRECLQQTGRVITLSAGKGERVCHDLDNDRQRSDYGSEVLTVGAETLETCSLVFPSK